MSTIFRSTLLTQLGWTWRDEQDRAVVSDSNRWSWQTMLNEGTQPGEANAVWYAVGRTLAAGSSTEWALDALSRALFGKTIVHSFSAVKALWIANRSESSGTLALGGATNNPWLGPLNSATSILRLAPGGVFFVVHPGTGWSVSSSAKALKLAAESGAVTYDMILIGILG
ncbi:MAG: hypothetical protein ACUVQG_03885 [Thermogutta sp.]